MDGEGGPQTSGGVPGNTYEKLHPESASFGVFGWLGMQHSSDLRVALLQTGLPRSRTRARVGAAFFFWRRSWIGKVGSLMLTGRE